MVGRFAAKIDCHVHSQYSPDGTGTLAELVATAREKGLTGIAVTDHNTLRMAQDMKTSGIRDFTLIPGIEVSTKQGHCLALGVRAEIPRGLPLVAAIEAIEAAGGVAVPSHPFRTVHGVGEIAIMQSIGRLRAIEVYNARDGKKASNHQAFRLAEAQNLGGTGGSDAHRVVEAGNAYARFKDPVEDADDLIDQIRKRTTWGVGVPTPRSLILRQNLKNAWLFARRGFHGI